MASKEVVIESMWSPAVALRQVAQGVNVLYAAPPEGFRGWCSAEGISSKVTDPAKLQACYDYINWNYNGYLGATIMRQGYYIANGQKLLAVDQVGRGQEGRRSRRPSTTTGGAASRRRATCPGITGKVGDIKKGERARGRLVPEAHLQVRLLELVLRARASYLDQDGERLPRPPSDRMAEQASREPEGAAAAAPSAIERVRARPRSG